MRKKSFIIRADEEFKKVLDDMKKLNPEISERQATRIIGLEWSKNKIKFNGKSKKVTDKIEFDIKF